MNQPSAFRQQSVSFLLQIVCFGSLGILLLMFPKEIASGATQGLQLCFSSLIGAILPFLVVSKLCLLRGLHHAISGKRAFFTRCVLRLPAVCAAVVAGSMIGGYPVGASMAADLAKDGSISPSQARRLMLFCVGPGPSFAISAVGAGMRGSTKAGVVLYISVVCGALLTGVLTRLFFRPEPIGNLEPMKSAAPLPLAESINRAVSESVQAMLMICGFVALFSALLQLPAAMQLPQSVCLAAAPLLEVTNGCRVISPRVSLPVLSLVVAWGGFCTHCQLSPCLSAVRLPFFRFLCFRALHAGCSFLCCRAALKIVKIPARVMLSSVPAQPALAKNYLLSLCMCMMCVLLLFGSGCSLRFGRAK